MDRRSGLMVVNYDKLSDYEPRVHRLGRDVELPGRGVPLRSVFYALAVFALLVGLGQLPVIGELVETVPIWMRLAVLPALGAVVLTSVNVEGLAPHRIAEPLLRSSLTPRSLNGWVPCEPVEARWRPADVIVLADGTRPGPMTYTGPGTVVQRARTTATRRPTRRPIADRCRRHAPPARQFEVQDARRARPRRITVPAGVSVRFEHHHVQTEDK